MQSAIPIYAYYTKILDSYINHQFKKINKLYQHEHNSLIWFMAEIHGVQFDFEAQWADKIFQPIFQQSADLVNKL